MNPSFDISSTAQHQAGQSLCGEGRSCSFSDLPVYVRELLNLRSYWLVNIFIESVKSNMSYGNQVSLGGLNSRGDRANELSLCHR